MKKMGWLVKFKEMLFEGEGFVKTPQGLSMYDGLMEAVEYIWVNMWIASTKPQCERGASLEESFHLCGHARKS